MPSALYPKNDFAKQAAEKQAKKREEDLLRLNAAAIEVTKGNLIAPERVMELCAAAGMTEQDFDDAVDLYGTRVNSNIIFIEASAAQADRDELEAKRGQLVASYERQLAELDSKIGECDIKLRDADKARRFLLDTVPEHVRRAIRSVKKEIRQLESLIGSRVSLSEAERSLIHSSFNGGGYEAWPGVNAAAARAAIESVKQKQIALDDRKSETQVKLDELRKQKNRLIACAMIPIPTDEDLEAAKRG